MFIKLGLIALEGIKIMIAQQTTDLQQQYNYAAPFIGMPLWTDKSNTYGGIQTYGLNQSYIQAIIDAGGIPITIPLNLDKNQLWILFNQLDGLFLSGGSDISPELYGGKTTIAQVQYDYERDQTELTLTKWALEFNLPVFGVCRGMQMINVAAGGTLYHDLASDRPDVGKHDFFSVNADRKRIRHSIFIESNSILGNSLGDIAGVNSMHHQSVEKLGTGLRVTAISEDGLIEGIESEAHSLLLGCQWHPEELTTNPNQEKLFTYFVQTSSTAVRV